MTSFHDRAGNILPGAVNSPVRAWGAVGGAPVPIASAAGSRVTDADGREYVDLVGSWGPAIVGHAHPAVVEAVTEAATRGLSFGATHESEVELAEEIRRRYPPAERVRLVSSGTEATMTAIRIARAATGRDLIVKFAGCYHGHSDGLLVSAGSGLATAGVPDSAGVPAAVAALTAVLPYGDPAALRAFMQANGRRVAAIIVEAAPANMGVVAPPAGFNAAIASACADAGAVFILDEVLTGFRVGPRGWWGIEADDAVLAGEQPWVPDLVTFGKVIGGGLPLAAVAGRAELMGLLAPAGRVYQAGTLAGNPVAVAAGRATLDLLDAAAYAAVDNASLLVETAATSVLSEAKMRFAVGRAGNLFSIFLGLANPPADFDEAAWQDTAGYARLFHALRDHGVLAPPSAFEAWFVSTQHGEPEAEAVAVGVAAFVEAEARR